MVGEERAACYSNTPGSRHCRRRGGGRGRHDLRRRSGTGRARSARTLRLYFVLERPASRARAEKVSLIISRIHASTVDPCRSGAEHDVPEGAPIPPCDALRRLQFCRGPFQFGSNGEELVRQIQASGSRKLAASTHRAATECLGEPLLLATICRGFSHQYWRRP